METLILTARDMYEMQILGKEQCTEIKKELATTNQEKKCFKSGKSGHFKRNFSNKNSNQNGKGNTTTCHLCGRSGHKMAKFWENPENASK